MVELLPAIDLRHGAVVRSRHGHAEAANASAPDLAQMLRELARAGVRRVHLVDLDAGLGEPPQRALLERVLALRQRPAVQLGGGMTNDETVGWAFAAGCERVVIGALAAEDPYAFAELCERYPLRMIPALDVAGDRVRVDGWTSDAELGVDDVCGTLRGLPCAAVLVKDVARDRTLEGVNVRLARDVARATDLPVLLAGGIGSLQDLRAAARVQEIEGVVVGRPLLDGSFTLGEALVACRAAAERRP